MPIVKNISLIQQIKDAHPNYFTPENKRFFNDVNYYGLYGKVSHKPYLIQATYKWSDMFGQPKKLTHVIHPINSETMGIESALDEEFRTMNDVKEWMEEN